MEFKFTIKTKKGKMIVEETVNFEGFPENWKNEGMALKSLYDYQDEFIHRHIETDFKQIQISHPDKK